MGSVIEVDNLHKRYGGTVAVDDVSFTVALGEIFGIPGRNGAGKTTTVECLMGLRTLDRRLDPHSGPRPPTRPRRATRRVGVQLQDSQLPERLRVGEAADGAEAVRLAEAPRPDVILMDLRMAGMDGVTAIGELTWRGVPARVLVLTTYDTDSHVLPAIEAGATGYLLKDAPRDELLRGVRSAGRGEVALSPSVAARLMSRLRTPAPPPDCPMWRSGQFGSPRTGT